LFTFLLFVTGVFALEDSSVSQEIQEIWSGTAPNSHIYQIFQQVTTDLCEEAPLVFFEHPEAPFNQSFLTAAAQSLAHDCTPYLAEMAGDFGELELATIIAGEIMCATFAGAIVSFAFSADSLCEAAAGDT